MKAALFDLDGVVFDTEPQYTIFWGGIFREYNPGNDGLEEKIKGSTLVEIYEKYFADRPDVQESITQRLNDFETHMQFNYVPCFVDYVLQLRAAGVKTAIVTSSNRDKMNALYRQRPEVKRIISTQSSPARTSARASRRPTATSLPPPALGLPPPNVPSLRTVSTV